MSHANFEDISKRPVAACTTTQVADALTRSFEGYVVPVNVSPEAYERRFRPENVDPFASYAYFRETRPIAVVLVARRGWTSRIAAMAVAPGARGKGLGKRIMQGVIDEAVERGDRSVLLEVFEHNTPAVNLYEGLGFEPLRRLVGYRHDPGGAVPEVADTLSELDPLAFARVVSLTALVVPRVNRRHGWGTRLLQALFATQPDKAWAIPQIVPAELAPEFFARCGWELMDTNQLEMVLDLAQKSEDDQNG